jgi:hypothetical protein
VTSVARLGQLVRTTTFRLTAVFILIFIVFSIALLAFITYESSIAIQRQQAADINRDVQRLEDVDLTDGIRAVAFAVDRLAGQPGPGWLERRATAKTMPRMPWRSSMRLSNCTSRSMAAVCCCWIWMLD